MILIAEIPIFLLCRKQVSRGNISELIEDDENVTAATILKAVAASRGTNYQNDEMPKDLDFVRKALDKVRERCTRDHMTTESLSKARNNMLIFIVKFTVNDTRRC